MIVIAGSLVTSVSILAFLIIMSSSSPTTESTIFVCSLGLFVGIALLIIGVVTKNRPNP